MVELGTTKKEVDECKRLCEIALELCRVGLKDTPSIGYISQGKKKNDTKNEGIHNSSRCGMDRICK